MDNESQLIKQRREKYDKLLAMGIDPYPLRSERTHCIMSLWENEKDFVEKEQEVSVTGRINAKRRQGKIGFLNLQDSTGRVQIFVRNDTVLDDNYELFKLLDLGDFLQVDGKMIRTQTGEYSVLASKLTLLAKNMRPIPTVKEKEVDGKIIRYDEFSDIEIRYRKRYLDLLLNPEHKKVFETRSRIIQGMRDYLNKRAF